MKSDGGLYVTSITTFKPKKIKQNYFKLHTIIFLFMTYVPTEILIVLSVRGLSSKLSVGELGLTVAEHTYEPLSLDFNVLNVTDVLYISCTPSKSDTITLLSWSVNEEWPLH